MAETPPTPPPSAVPPPSPAPSGPPPVPAEVQGGWNWGAFFLSWIWAIAHSAWTAFAIGFIAWLVGLHVVGMIILGVKGNEWGWQGRHFDSVEQFKAVQRAWAIWGLIIFIACIVLLVLFWGAIIALVLAGTAAESMG